MDRASARARQRAVARALDRAQCCRLLAAAFRYPDLPRLERLVHEAARASGLRSRAVARGLASALEQETDAGALAGEYNRLFAQQVACSPYGGTYRGGDRGADLAVLNRCYRAFGVAVRGPGRDDPPGELPDHAGVELEFAGLLAVKEALARRERRAAALEVTRNTLRWFLAEHLAAWAPRFAAALRAATADPFYRCAADQLAAFVAAEIRRLRLHLAPLRRRVPLPVLEDGACEALRLDPDAAP